MKSKFGKLNLLTLEDRVVPASLYQVQLESPPQGERGESALTVTDGGLHSAGEVTANSAIDAVIQALSGSVRVGEQTYELTPETISTNPADQRPFLLVETEQGYEIRLEDLAATPQVSDWDYNDHAWFITAEERAEYQQDDNTNIETLPSEVGTNPAPINNQGKPPEIDYTKAVLLRRGVKPYPDSPNAEERTLVGDFCRVTIGKDAVGNDIDVIFIKITNDQGVLRLQYWCHGLTIGSHTKEKMSPGGVGMVKILDMFYKPVTNAQAQAGDIMVWRDSNGIPQHSCIIEMVVLKPDGTLDQDKTMVRTKNEFSEEKSATLKEVHDRYNTAQKPTTLTLFTRR